MYFHVDQIHSWFRQPGALTGQRDFSVSPLLQLLHGGSDLIGLLLQTADHIILLLHLLIR